MSSETGPDGPATPGQEGRLDRRRFLGLAGAAGAAAVLAPVPDAAPGALSAAQRIMILQVARAGAVFPIEFPRFGEAGPATSRATDARLRQAARRACGTRLTLARAGSDALISHGLAGQSRTRLLQGVGRLAATGGRHRELTAVVALAIATVSRHFDPDSDAAAQVWLDGLSGLHHRGALAGRFVR